MAKTNPDMALDATAKGNATANGNTNGNASADPRPVLRIDGSAPPTPETVAAVHALCDRAEDRGADRGGPGVVVLQVSGAPRRSSAPGLTVSLVTKWERALRRLESLPAATVAVADGDCGGTALDALLAADYRVATRGVRLLVPLGSDATWPGMALYRLANQGSISAPIRRAVLFGTPIEAADALSLHLVDELTDDAGAALAAAADRVAALSGTELAIRRQLMFDASTASFEEALGAHLAACDRELRRSAGAVA